MTPFLVINIIVMAAGLISAAFHSLEVRKAATAFFIGWLFCVSSYLPDGFSPRDIIYIGTGEHVKSPQLWMAMDCVVGLYIASLSIPFWARFTLWMSFTIQCSFHILRLNDIFDFATYSAILDKIFIVQIAVFLALGWPNVRLGLHGIVERWGRTSFGQWAGKSIAQTMATSERLKP